MSYNWQTKRRQPGHVDDWLITYADMITLLLCFFVIFLIVTLSKKDLPHPEPVKHVTAELHVPHILVPVQQPIIEQPPPQPETKYPAAFQGNLPFHDMDPEHYAKPVETPAPQAVPLPPAAAEAAPVPVDTPPAPAPEVPATLPQIVDNLKAEGSATVEQKGDRISSIEMNSAAFFAVGSAALSEDGKSILQKVAQNLKAPQFDGYRITVEGHTDDSPIDTTQFPSNWELSTARASAVVHYFLQQGIAADRLRAAGYADTFPKAPNRDAQGNAIPANQAQNRRVVIKLEKIEKSVP